MDYARLQILTALKSAGNVHVSVCNDFTDCSKWLPDCQLLVTYVAGPFADDEQTAAINAWLERGGRWLALHGSSGGKAVRVEGKRQRRWVKTAYHEALGSFFLTHPPIAEFNVKVENADHPLMKGLPGSFPVRDEPYMIEVIHPDTELLLTTTDIETPDYVPDIYGTDLSLLPDGQRRALGYVRSVGEGAVAYFAFGHCHSPTTNIQVTVDTTISADGSVPRDFHGVWVTEHFRTLLGNALEWGLDQAA
tara:strand:- start:38 stop:784 length:747 start_codon:yes stop_codon:yes gene_type:complete